MYHLQSYYHTQFTIYWWLLLNLLNWRTFVLLILSMWEIQYVKVNHRSTIFNWDIRFSQWQCWRLKCSGMLCNFDWWTVTNVLKDDSAFIFRVKEPKNWTTHFQLHRLHNDIARRYTQFFTVIITEWHYCLYIIRLLIAHMNWRGCGKEET